MQILVLHELIIEEIEIISPKVRARAFNHGVVGSSPTALTM
jgi:hypothetical protein